jgi:hypothetical protein
LVSVLPCRGTTKAQTFSPSCIGLRKHADLHRGWLASTRSTSCDAMFSPPRIAMSFCGR